MSYMLTYMLTYMSLICFMYAGHISYDICADMAYMLTYMSHISVFRMGSYAHLFTAVLLSTQSEGRKYRL